MITLSIISAKAKREEVEEIKRIKNEQKLDEAVSFLFTSIKEKIEQSKDFFTSWQVTWSNASEAGWYDSEIFDKAIEVIRILLSEAGYTCSDFCKYSESYSNKIHAYGYIRISW